MNAEKFKYCVTNKRLFLSFSEKLTHYAIVILFSVFSVIVLYFIVFENDNVKVKQSHDVFFYCVLVAFIFYVIQRRRTRFIIFETSLNAEQVCKVIDEVELQQKWKPYRRNMSYYLANAGKGALFQSWGERITILYFENKIYFNSICDPEKKPSISAWGRNWEHAVKFKRAVKLLEANVAKRLKDKAS